MTMTTSKPRKKPRPSAVQRTVSIFTGKTDLELKDGEGRDGSAAREKRWLRVLKTKAEWQPIDGRSLGEWFAAPFRRIRWDKETGRYLLTDREKSVGDFGSLTAAIAAADAATKMSTLKVWRNDVTDWVVASSPKDADAVCLEHTGDHPDDPHEWEALEDDKTLAITDDWDGKITTRTAAEWVASNGRGFLCSTEY